MPQSWTCKSATFFDWCPSTYAKIQPHAKLSSWPNPGIDVQQVNFSHQLWFAKWYSRIHFTGLVDHVISVEKELLLTSLLQRCSVLGNLKTIKLKNFVLTSPKLCNELGLHCASQHFNGYFWKVKLVVGFSLYYSIIW